MSAAMPDGDRAALYRLLGRLLLAEPAAEHLARLREWPAFAATLAGEDDAVLGALRAEYARLFLLNVYPYESVFVDPSVMLGAAPSASVEAVYEAVGLEIRDVPRPGAADHLGAELWCAARLVETSPPGAQRRFLEAHPAAFVAPFAEATARDARHPFYGVLAEVIADVVLADAARLAAAAVPAAVTPPAPVEVRGAGLATSDLATLARHLATPVVTGLLLTRETLHRLAGRLALPLPLLERSRMVESLFEAAGRFGQLSALLEGLEAEARRAAGRYATLAAEHPGARHLLAPWQARSGTTVEALGRMRVEAAAAARS